MSQAFLIIVNPFLVQAILIIICEITIFFLQSLCVTYTCSFNTRHLERVKLYAFQSLCSYLNVYVWESTDVLLVAFTLYRAVYVTSVRSKNLLRRLSQDSIWPVSCFVDDNAMKTLHSACTCIFLIVWLQQKFALSKPWKTLKLFSIVDTGQS